MAQYEQQKKEMAAKAEQDKIDAENAKKAGKSPFKFEIETTNFDWKEFEYTWNAQQWNII